MTLLVVDDRDLLQKTVDDFRKKITLGCKTLDRYVGYKGGREFLKVFWNTRLEYWSLFERHDVENKYWNGFGVQDPSNETSLSVTCEINFRIAGDDKSLGGVVLKDDYGNVYIGHTGNIGGGKKGIGKTAFWNYYRGGSSAILWPDGSQSNVTIIGPINDKNIQRLVASFVWEVARIKKAIDAGDRPGKPQTPQPSFNPEFSGKRRPYGRRGEVSADSYHGIVVNELAEQLRDMGKSVANDRHRDLYINDINNQAEVIFEAKTELSTTDCYMAIGQLMYHGACQESEPMRIAVLPGKPSTQTERVFSDLNIRILSYDWEKDRPKFHRLSEVLRKK